MEFHQVQYTGDFVKPDFVSVPESHSKVQSFTQSPEMSSELGYSTAHLCCTCMACHIICEAIKRPTLFTNISASSNCAPDLSAYHLLLRTCSANPLQQNSPCLPSGGAMLWQMHCQFAEMHCQLHCLHFRISKQNCVNNRTMLLP